MPQRAAPDADDLQVLSEQVTVLYDRGLYDQATPLAEKALALTERKSGSDSPEAASALEVLGILYYLQSRYPQAEMEYQRSIALRESLFGRSHPLLAASSGNLGLLYKAEGKYEQALRYTRGRTESWKQRKAR